MKSQKDILKSIEGLSDIELFVIDLFCGAGGLYGIVDIKMRMLRIPELKKIMGFPEDYVLIGTQADQKKFIGNAVEVTQARKNTEALCKVLRKLRLKKSKEIA